MQHRLVWLHRKLSFCQYKLDKLSRLSLWTLYASMIVCDGWHMMASHTLRCQTSHTIFHMWLYLALLTIPSYLYLILPLYLEGFILYLSMCTHIRCFALKKNFFIHWHMICFTQSVNVSLSSTDTFYKMFLAFLFDVNLL